MSTVSQGKPVRAMNRQAAMLPSESQVPICGFPARNALFTGFSFKVIPLNGIWNRGVLAEFLTKSPDRQVPSRDRFIHASSRAFEQGSQIPDSRFQKS